MNSPPRNMVRDAAELDRGGRSGARGRGPALPGEGREGFSAKAVSHACPAGHTGLASGGGDMEYPTSRHSGEKERFPAASHPRRAGWGAEEAAKGVGIGLSEELAY